MKTPTEILAEFAAIPYQDMIEYVPFLEAVSGGTVLEIGVCAGVSTSAFLKGMDDRGIGHLFSIDYDAGCANILAHPRWTFIHGDSKTVEIPVEEEKLDVLMVDGDHGYESVTSDLVRFEPYVKRGGLILCHDVASVDFPECSKAWFDFSESHPEWKMNVLAGRFGLGIIEKR